MRRLALPVGPPDEGERIDRFIAARGGISRGEARRALDAGGVFLDGRRCKVAGRAVRAGQRVVVNLAEGGREAGAAEPLAHAAGVGFASFFASFAPAIAGALSGFDSGLGSDRPVMAAEFRPL